jgi:hypothetical protein
MGKLMALCLICTMAAAVLFQPVLMGPPREKKQGKVLTTDRRRISELTAP